MPINNIHVQVGKGKVYYESLEEISAGGFWGEHALLVEHFVTHKGVCVCVYVSIIA